MFYQSFVDYLLPTTLALIMGGMGLSLEKKDFTNVLLHPKAIIIGLISQMLLLPLIAFVLVANSNLDPHLKVGFILIAACPGGTASNLVTYLLKGNLALCVSMSAVNSLLVLITLPLIVNLGLNMFMHTSAQIYLPVLDTVEKIFLIIAIPIFLGMFIRYKRKSFALKLEKPLQYILTSLLLGVFIVVIFFDESENKATQADFLLLIPYALALNLLSMIAGYALSMFTGLGNRNSYTISNEVGLQNSALAIFVATSLLGSSKMALVAVVYSSFTFFSTALFAFAVKNIFKKKPLTDN